MRAAIYVRASTEHQRYSTRNQQIVLADYAQRQGYEIVHCYEDDGRSGLSLQGRPGLRALLQDVMEDEVRFEFVLVYDVSRWGRFQDADEAAFYEHLCRRAGKTVVYVAEGFEGLTTSVAYLLKAMKRTMAAEYSADLSRRVENAMRQMVMRGFHVGGRAPYGLSRVLVDEHGRKRMDLAPGEQKAVSTDRVILAPGKPEEVRVVRWMFRQCAAGVSDCEIARRLNERGIPSAEGGIWHNSTVGLFLRNTRYIGVRTYGKTSKKLKRLPLHVPKENWIRLEGAWQGIVSLELFMAAQRQMDARRVTGPSDEFLIAGLKRLYAQHGRLTRDLIRKCPDLPCPEIYQKRFGSIALAYARVGFKPRNEAIFKRHPGHRRYQDADLFEVLRAVHRKHGRISRALIRGTPGSPHPETFARVFGSLDAAYRKAGIKDPILPGPRPTPEFENVYELPGCLGR